MTGLDPLEQWKITKLSSQHLMFGDHWPAGGPMIVNGVSLAGR